MLAIVLTVLCGAVDAGASLSTSGVASDLALLVRRTYDFSPSQVTSGVRDQKVKEMDAVWDLVKGDRARYLPQLRELLRDPGQDRFFLYDGAELLLSLSQERTDQQAAADAIARSSIPDVDPQGYFRTVHRLTGQGIKTAAAVLHMLDDPKFIVSVPAHALTLGRDSAVMMCAMLMEPADYVPSFAARLQREKDIDVVRALILAIAYAVTDESQRTLAEYARSATDRKGRELALTFAKLERQDALPKRDVKASRKDLDRFLQQFGAPDAVAPKIDPKDLPYLFVRKDLATLRALRKTAARRVSDEAIGEIQELTRLMQFAATAAE